MLIMTRTIMKKIIVTCALAVCLTFASSTRADWDLVWSPDGNEIINHEMHFPQLPDPNGWDVNFTTPKFLADDWKCSGSGPVSDIHFWVSHQDDVIPVLNGIDVRTFLYLPLYGHRFYHLPTSHFTPPSARPVGRYIIGHLLYLRILEMA